MSLDNIRNSAKAIIDEFYQYEREKDAKKKKEIEKHMIKLGNNMKKMIEEESGKY